MTSLPHPWLRFGAAASLTALLSFDADPAGACSCAGPPDPLAAMASADVVFEGSPRDTQSLEADLGLDGYRGARRFDFEVVRYFKGQLGPDVSIFTIDQGSACGRDYPLDEPHIIYARYTDSGLLTDSACSRSRPSSVASEDEPFLGDGVGPDPALASLDDEGPAASPVSSGIRHVPLAEREAQGCASLALPASPRQPRPWSAAAVGLSLLAWQAFRRRAR